MAIGMNPFLSNGGKGSKYNRLFEWGRLISITAFAQVLVQGIALVSGILVIRLLPTKEYALYTLANTMLGTMTLLADGGISTSVMAQGGSVYRDKEKLGIVLSTGLQLRKKFAVGSLLIATPILFYLLYHHGAPVLMSVLIVISLVPTFFASLSDTLLEIAPKLNQNIIALQRNQIASNFSRLVLTSITLFAFPFAFLAIVAAGISRIWANFRLRRITNEYAEITKASDPVTEREIIKTVKRILPGAIYYCVSGQITIWLISVFGSTDSVAEVGALGRLSALLMLFNVLFSTLIVPRFARLPKTKSLLLKRYFQLHIIILIISIVIVGLVSLFPEQILWILGKNYAGLTTEIKLNIIGSCLSLIAGCSFLLYTSRGWVIYPVISIGISVASIIAGVLFFNVSSLLGIFKMNIFLAVVQVLLHGTYGILKIVKLKTV